MESRFVDWQAVGDLSGFLNALNGGGKYFSDATEADRARADTLDQDILEQSRPHLDEDGYPSEGSEGFAVVLAPEDWAFLERWFTDEQRLGPWAMPTIGIKVAQGSDTAVATQTRMMTWSSESALITELHWLSAGAGEVLHPDGTSRPLTAEEITGATHAFALLLAQEHDEPVPCGTQDDGQLFALTLPVEAWALIDTLCAGVDFGWGIGVVGVHPEAA